MGADTPTEGGAALVPASRRSRSRSKLYFRKRASVLLASKDGATSTSGTTRLSRLPGTLKLEIKDNNSVFVAGATGRVGSRTVRELLKLGLRVRAGVRSEEKFRSLFEDVLETKSSSSTVPFFFFLANLFGFRSLQRRDPVQVVECNLEKPDEIEEALGNCGVVICAIGASESEILDVTGPYRVDYRATENLIEAAKNANVNHFVLLTSLGTTKFGWPAAVLNLFWGVLIWKGKAERALIESGLVYTIVRPGGMERPTDAFKETHNLRLAPKDSFTGGQVSRLQVAELLACIASNLELAEDKVVEAIAETSAPLRPIEELLAELPSKVPTATGGKVSIPESPADNKGSMNKKDERQRKAEKDVSEANKMEVLRQKLESEFRELKEQERIAQKEAEMLQTKKAQIFERANAAAEAASRARALATAIVDASKTGQLLSEEEKQKILTVPMLPEPSTMQKVVARKSTITKPQVSSKVSKETTPSKVSKEEAPSKVVSKEVPSNVSKKVPTPVKEIEAVPSGVSVKPSSNGSISSSPVEDKPRVEEQKQAAIPISEDKPSVEEQKQVVPTIDDNPVEKQKQLVPTSSSSPINDDKPIEEQKQAQANAAEEGRKPFRWFWQPVEPENDALASSTPEASETIPIGYASPLSPYTRYEDMKPPSSPMPSPPCKMQVETTPDAGAEQSLEAEKTSWKTSVNEAGSGAVAEVPEEAQPDGKSSRSPDLEEPSGMKARPLSPYARYGDLKPPSSPTPSVSDKPSSNGSISSSPVEDKPRVEEQKQAAIPISEDKPSVEEQKQVVPTIDDNPVEKQKQLVPTSSSSPINDDKPIEEQKQVAQANAAKEGRKPFRWFWQPVEPESDALASSTPEASETIPIGYASPLSPYTRYEDMKPPSSPMPSPPCKMQVETTPDAGAEQSLEAEKTSWKTSVNEAGSGAVAEVPEEAQPDGKSSRSPDLEEPSGMKARPLSPYARYGDLKPPSSPTPSPPSPVEQPAAAAAAAATAAEKQEKSGVEEANEKAALGVEKARAALKWPW